MTKHIKDYYRVHGKAWGSVLLFFTAYDAFYMAAYALAGQWLMALVFALFLGFMLWVLVWSTRSYTRIEERQRESTERFNRLMAESEARLAALREERHNRYKV